MKSGYDVQYSFDMDMECPILFLNQGEYYISDDNPVIIRTILGSCVTVTMHCPVNKIGAITHSLLPYPLPGTKIGPGHHGRFVNSSVRHAFERILARGAKKNRLEVKVFGGGQMLLPPSGQELCKEINIGRRNVETALKVISELGLKITATDVGGTWGRKLMFFPHRGDVWVKKIIRSADRARGKHE